jgi:hypothetical protein
MATYSFVGEEVWLGKSGVTTNSSLVLQAEGLFDVKEGFLLAEGVGDTGGWNSPCN